MREIQEIVDSFVEKPLFALGYYGPLILIVMNIYALWDQFFWICAYLVFIVINMYLNKALKLIIKEPRPENWKRFVSMEKLENEEQYGMPSGHAQSVTFSLIYCFLITHSFEYLYVMLFIAVLTLYQRYSNRNHTALQLLIGSIIGCIFAYIVVYILRCYSKKIPFL
jgi:membrane-associated phospholipid phosphatase